MKIIKTETGNVSGPVFRPLAKWSIAETYSFYWFGWREVCCIECGHSCGFFLWGAAHFFFYSTLNSQYCKSQVSFGQMVNRDLLQLTLICIALVLFGKKREPGDKNMQKISSCDSENTICTGIDLLHNVNNSHLKPSLTPVHICKNADSCFMSLRFMAFTSRLIFCASSYGTSRAHHGGIVCIIVCLGLCLVTYNRCWWTEWWLFKKL